ncbi:MAG: PKD domain-containing protein [Ilumatobacteraceae bacterium]
MITVTGTYAGTVQALAQANGPYVVDAATSLVFTGDPDRPNTTYEWDFGDGVTATGRVVTHSYADNGVYVAKLKTTVNQPGGVVTREFAQVRVRNVPPTVDAGAPLEVDEGSELEVVATFTDPEWPDTHRALFHWGDNTPPTAGVVTETNAPPSAAGTARGKHTWCDSGTFSVEVEVEDDDGGVGVGEVAVVVRNVAPTVACGPDLFAYRCTPLNLVARFTDPGWCDTHIGFWDFGDCTPLQPATVRELHEPPVGTGVAIATHRYDTCGEFLASCVVIDDDGGRGRDALVVRVVDVRNGDMEHGFRHLNEGVVANEWEPYVGPALTPNPFVSEALEQPVPLAPKVGGALFSADEFVVHGGRRSQCITADGRVAAGLRQSVGTNEGWDYQVTCWYHINEHTGGTARLGVDPNGGTDPTSSAVIWSEGTQRHTWTQLTVRVTAVARTLTMYLDGQSADRAELWFDDVELVPFPCPAPKPAKPGKHPGNGEVESCIDWRAEKESRRLVTPYERDGFVFEADKGVDLRVVTWGAPPDEGKLALPDSGVDIGLPQPSQRIVATVAVHTHDAVTVTAVAADGQPIAEASSTARTGNMDRVVVEGESIARVRIGGGGNEGLLIRLCAIHGSRRRARPR